LRLRPVRRRGLHPGRRRLRHGREVSHGACPDKTACVVPACSEAECLPLTCKTNGVGDARAYCTKLDCADDSQCPGGYYCGITRDPHTICGLMPEKGNNTVCGKTAEACVDPATFGMGNTYFEG